MQRKKVEVLPASSSRPFTGKISKIHLFQRIINTFLIWRSRKVPSYLVAQFYGDEGLDSRCILTKIHDVRTTAHYFASHNEYDDVKVQSTSIEIHFLIDKSKKSKIYSDLAVLKINDFNIANCITCMFFNWKIKCNIENEINLRLILCKNQDCQSWQWKSHDTRCDLFKINQGQNQYIWIFFFL